VRVAVTRATIRLDRTADNVAGVTLPKFKMREILDSDISTEKVGIFGGGHVIEQTKAKFKEFLEMVIKIASMQVSRG
jgi:vacuolar-type H+-ATPase subunit D/Vma8